VLRRPAEPGTELRRWKAGRLKSYQ